MYVLNITDDYEIITLSNCTDNENKIDVIRLTFLLKIPCGLSFFCLMSLLIYTIIKPLFKNR